MFFGGHWFIKIESIRIRATMQNFETFIYSLWCFDKMLTGDYVKKVSDSDISIIGSLMDNILGQPTTKTFDPYIISTFDCFCKSKQEINLNLEYLHNYNNNKMTALIMNEMAESEEERKCDDLTNLFRSQT